MEDTVRFELDASHKGWKCSGCSLFVDCIGRPIFGKETWVINSTGITWIENKPKFHYCPGCGKAVKELGKG